MKTTNYHYLLEGSYNQFGKVIANQNHKQAKHVCPDCHKRSFVRFLDTKTGNYIPEKYGKCDHESKCGYYLSPYKDGYSAKTQNEEWEERNSKPQYTRPLTKKSKSITYVPEYILKGTLKDYANNTFIQNLLNNVQYPISYERIEKVISQYYLGTISKGYLTSGTTLPFIDFNGNIRVIQAKIFDNNNNTTKTGNIHSILDKHYGDNKPEWLKQYLNNHGFFTCLFGEHLLKKYPNNSIALVEAPKTAIYGTLYFGFPDNPSNLLWLAVYNISALNYERCKILDGRKVILFPDLSKSGKAYSLWKEKANYFNTIMPNTSFIVSDILEKCASDKEKQKGGDLADFLINQDWRNFQQSIKHISSQHQHSPTILRLITKNKNLDALIRKFDLELIK